MILMNSCIMCVCGCLTLFISTLKGNGLKTAR